MYMHSPSLGRHNCVCLCREIEISDARAMRKAGKALSPDSRTAQGLDLTPEHQFLLARCVSVIYIYVYTHIQMYIGICIYTRMYTRIHIFMC